MNSHETSAAALAVAGLPFDDDSLETLLVHLVGRLEQQMMPLERTEQVKQLTRMIEVSLGMLVTIIDTGIENHGIHFFAKELPAVWRLREQSKLVLDLLDRESWSNVFGLNPKAKSTTLTMHRNLGQDFMQLFRDLLARFAAELPSAKQREDFDESCAVLLEDFTERW